MKEIVLLYGSGQEIIQEYPKYVPDMNRTDSELIAWIKARREANPVYQRYQELKTQMKNLMQNPAWKELETADDGYHFSYDGGGYRVGSVKAAENLEWWADYPVKNWDTPVEDSVSKAFRKVCEEAGLDVNALGLDSEPHIYKTPQEAYNAAKSIMLKLEDVKTELGGLSKFFEHNNQPSDGFTILSFDW